MLGVSCWLKFENGQTRGNNTQHVATHRNTVAKRKQHVTPNNISDMLRWRVAIVWLGLYVTWSRSTENANQAVRNGGSLSLD